ncbi:PfkB family carbohydrate kinase [Saccharicrinis aurantiacus]|uniref:PfkB family carbohydrate kinase n=1 Tax=Saccharicrinis aurantiacus TaxID=1849719 RepID=UPI0008393C73|nr:PfkB family carbohydrate kinase [Saccharicrinis aurantiacus]
MRVFGLGETVYDIIFKDGTPQAAKPGGSVLNSMISLARMGVETYFISELGNDNISEIIISFLNKNGVSTQYIQQHNNGQSAVAMAFLNENNDASYEFYKNYPKTRLDIELPDFREGDILLYGSSYAIDKNIRKQVKSIINRAKSAGATIMYDPNYRQKDGANDSERILFVKENLLSADIIRGSNEDFLNILNARDIIESHQNTNPNCHLFIYTKNALGIDAIFNDNSKSYLSDKITPISTIGAGDNFNAGIIYSIIQLGLLKNNISTINDKQVDYIISNAKQFSSAVCMSMDNYIPIGFTLK